MFDYDFGLQDDFMGSAFLDLTQLELNPGNFCTVVITMPCCEARLLQQKMSTDLGSSCCSVNHGCESSH